MGPRQVARGDQVDARSASFARGLVGLWECGSGWGRPRLQGFLCGTTGLGVG